VLKVTLDEARWEKIIGEWKEKGIKWVRFELPDMGGQSRCKIIPIDNAKGFAQKGLNMYGGTAVLDSASSVVPGTLYNEEVNYADQRLIPDLDTAYVVPWADRTASFICDTYWENGQPLEAAPRNVCKRVLAELDRMGYKAKIGLEWEFYILDAEGKPFFGGVHIFNAIRNTYLPEVQDMLEMLPQVGIDIITFNCEYAPSQFEINYKPAENLRAADLGFICKNGIKAISHRHGHIATFMTKPFSDTAASGAHIHISLYDKNTGKNVFLDPNDPDGISELCRYFVRGQLDHAAATMALMAPTENCYKRYVPHHFAPSNVSWGFEDRSALVRVKNFFDERTHIENRLPSGLANPYLIVAAAVAAGILGIKAKKLPDPPVEGPAEDCPYLPKLPRSILESVAALEADREMRELLGEEFVTAYKRIKEFEIARFRSYVTDWERNEYLELY
jgi:glutamine synthetase